MGLFDGVGKFFDDVGKSVDNFVDSAVSHLDNVKTDVKKKVTTAAGDVFDKAYDFLETVAPAGAVASLQEIRGGVKDIYSQAVDWLDPVTFATDSFMNAGKMLLSTPKKSLGAMKRIASGDVGGGLQQWGEAYLGGLMTEADLFLTVMPAGSVAKAATKPIKKGIKALKKEVKHTPKGVERDALKHQVHREKLKKTAISTATRSGTITFKREAQPKIRAKSKQLRSTKPDLSWTDRGELDINSQELSEWMKRQPQRK